MVKHVRQNSVELKLIINEISGLNRISKEKDIEVAGIEIKINMSTKIKMVTIYRSPSGDIIVHYTLRERNVLFFLRCILRPEGEARRQQMQGKTSGLSRGVYTIFSTIGSRNIYFINKEL